MLPRWSLRASLFVACLGLLSAAPANALVLSVIQQGPDVVVIGSGSVNTSALTPQGGQSDYSNVLSPIQIYAGPAAFSDGRISLWGGLIGPAVFGTDPGVFEYPATDLALSHGDLFGILTSATSADIRLILPDGYTSGASLNGRTTYTGLTLAQVGLTSGQIYTWAWGSDTDAESLQLRVVATPAAPTPAPAPLPIAGAAAAFHSMGRLRRRRQHLSNIST